MNKEKFIVEYDLKSVSPTLLWSYIGTKNGLACRRCAKRREIIYFFLE